MTHKDGIGHTKKELPANRFGDRVAHREALGRGLSIRAGRAQDAALR
jgi:hypothetical protein